MANDQSTSKSLPACPACCQVMHYTHVCACTHFAPDTGAPVQRLPHVAFFGERCGQCQVDVGSPHHAGCANEVCPFCQAQAFSCECAYSYTTKLIVDGVWQ